MASPLHFKTFRFNHSSSLSPLVNPSLPPLKVSLSLGAPFGPDAMGVPTLETAAVERPSAGVVSSKSWSWGCFSVSSFSLATVAAYISTLAKCYKYGKDNNKPQSYRHLDRVDFHPHCRVERYRTEGECPLYTPSSSGIPSC